MPKKLTLLLLPFFFIACNQSTITPSPPAPFDMAQGEPDTSKPDTPSPNAPKIISAELDRPELPCYGSLEFTIALDAEYTNPYDAREITLDGTFTAPDESTMTVPGFWDAKDSWRLRFTPWMEGEWHYALTATDANGSGVPAEGRFAVTPSDLHGWLLPGNRVNPAYSPRYLAYHDGTPFYGVGHGEALNILTDGFDAEEGVRLFDNMKAADENYVLWWPFYTNSPVNGSYNQYNAGNVGLIDTVVRDAEKEGVFIVFTIWDHPNLRDDTHEWDTGNWSKNGFNKLVDLPAFFTDPEAWAWQENLYRYTITRWGYSPAIAMWMTVSEINGTNAYAQLNPWHEKVNAYFIENDPYHHPTTASMSGDVDWPEGHAVMDVPQVHLYGYDDAVGGAEVTARWTAMMFERYEKPNWVGEYGVGGNTLYPELFHNATWAALASGAAMTPAEWNGGGFWSSMTPEMYADISRFAQFVVDLPLVQWNPTPLQLTLSDPQVRGWGIAGNDGGVIWVQDFSMEDKSIQEVRAHETLRSGVHVEIQGLSAGPYTLTPYNTWQGTILDPIEIECPGDQTCLIPLPDFKADMAFKIERK
ncbi:MAG TPA: DUF5060 domain-containing protein [Anaerolineales bacterium]|nr:DUF5060 domain-containing protein [Anaerolineales bacterium]